ncbi:MAG TPA: hypothetical protein VNK07_00280 [Candidatus Binatia bacterium]|nr:hypothetical protein [Candidatus Binatia bacterium]
MLLATFWEPSPIGSSDAVPYFTLFVLVPSFLIAVFFLTLRGGSYYGGTMMGVYGVLMLYMFSVIQLGPVDLFHTIPILFSITFIVLGIVGIAQKTRKTAFPHRRKILPIIGFVMVLPLLVTWYVNDQPPPYYSSESISDTKLYEITDALDQVKAFKEKYPAYQTSINRNGYLEVQYYYSEDFSNERPVAYIKMIVTFNERYGTGNIFLYCINHDKTESATKLEIVDYLRYWSCLDA